MPRDRRRRCEYCGDPATFTIQTRERRRTTWLCTKAVCQARYYRQIEEDQK